MIKKSSFCQVNESSLKLSYSNFNCRSLPLNKTVMYLSTELILSFFILTNNL